MMENNKKILNMINLSILTNHSKEKFDKFYINFDKSIVNDNVSKKILNDMEIAFRKDIDLIEIKKMNIDDLKSIFIDFDINLNKIVNSKFQNDIMAMQDTLSVMLIVNKSKIIVNFLCDSLENNFGYVSAIIHALNTFCHMFKHDYNELIINLSLDNNHRIIDIPDNITDYDYIFSHLKKKSCAFNVSGLTQKYIHKIILTRKEEIIKLMFHELVHYVGLEHEISQFFVDFGWTIDKKMLNISEGYTEFVSVVLNCAYLTMHFYGLFENDKYELFCKLLLSEYSYSLFLTSNILKFYGYNHQSFRNFFNGIGNSKKCPIYIWEYVILRTQLLTKLNQIFNVTDRNFMVNSKNKQKIIDVMKIDDNLLNELSFFMKTTDTHNNISYLIFDVNWNLI